MNFLLTIPYICGKVHYVCDYKFRSFLYTCRQHVKAALGFLLCPSRPTVFLCKTLTFASCFDFHLIEKSTLRPVETVSVQILINPFFHTTLFYQISIRGQIDTS